MGEQGKFSRTCYKILWRLVKAIYPKITVEGVENLPAEPCIVVGNHSQIHGPLVCELYFPGEHYTWCAGQMMHLQEVPAYAYQDFWSGKPKYIRWLYKIISYVIAPLSVCVFNNANTIAVYRDARLISTFRNTLNRLYEGANVIVFPECYEEHNNIVSNFQDKFINIAKHYYKRSGRQLPFVPLYIAPKMKKIYLGKPTYFCADAQIEQERRRICDYLMDEITNIAVNLPRHTVIPYSNISKKYYPTNIPDEVTNNHEKTGR